MLHDTQLLNGCPVAEQVAWRGGMGCAVVLFMFSGLERKRIVIAVFSSSTALFGALLRSAIRCVRGKTADMYRARGAATRL